MESILATLAPLIPPAAIPLVFVIVVYFIINKQRENTAKKRDEFQSLIEFRVKLLETNQNTLTESIKELETSIVNLQISVNSLIVEIKNLQRENRNE